MALFTRRVLQDCLNCSTSFATNTHRKDWIKRLNSREDDYLANEWEIVLLRQFSKLGVLEHEPRLEGSSLLDVVFRDGDLGLKFAAEIVGVSDRALHKANPVDYLRNEVERMIKKGKISQQAHS